MKSLTAKQSTVLACLCQGMSNADIAKHLKMRLRTVKNHVQRIGLRWDIDQKKFHIRVRIIYLHYMGGYR